MKNNALAEQPDEVLVRLTLEQGSHFFGNLVKRHSNYLYGLGMRLSGGNHAMAHDVSQQAFIKAFKYLHSFDADHIGLGKDSANRFRNWLTGIATNCHTDLARSESKYGEYKEDEIQDIDSGQQAQSAAAELNEFEEMIKPLSTHERQLITLRFVYEFSIAEIAGMLSLKSGTVKSQISRTVAKLRNELESTESDANTKCDRGLNERLR